MGNGTGTRSTLARMAASRYSTASGGQTPVERAQARVDAAQARLDRALEASRTASNRAANNAFTEVIHSERNLRSAQTSLARAKGESVAKAPKAAKSTPAETLTRAHAVFRAAANGTDEERLAAAKALVAADNAARRAAAKESPSAGRFKYPTPVATSGPSLDNYNPYAPVSAYTLTQYYGRAQMPAVLERASMAQLRSMTNEVMSRNPGTKPTSKSSKQAVTDYILAHLGNA